MVAFGCTTTTTSAGPGGKPVGSSSLSVPSEAISVETEGETTVESTSMAGEIMRRMGLHSAIVVSDGYHIFRVKKMLESSGLKVYGSPRPSIPPGEWRARWQDVRQAVGYLLWRMGIAV